MKKTVCAGGFLIEANKYLFGKRSLNKDWAPGVWDIAGGKSLKNELPLDTLKREVFEELAIRIEDARLLRTVNISDDSRAGFFTYHIYMITTYSGNAVNVSNEHSEIRWFTRKELNSVMLALPEYLTLIDEWQQGKFAN